MPEPSLEFIGQRLKAFQDEQYSIRNDIRMLTNSLGVITNRLDMIVTRMDRQNDRMDTMLQLPETRFNRIEELINEKVK